MKKEKVKFGDICKCKECGGNYIRIYRNQKYCCEKCRDIGSLKMLKLRTDKEIKRKGGSVVI